MNVTFFKIAIFFMCLFILNEFVKSKYHINTENIELSKIFDKKRFSKLIYNKRQTIKRSPFIINRKSGNKSLVMMDSGTNKATVMATLRQITGLDYNTAKQIVNYTPMEFMINISNKEANLTKQALEFVGAKIEIK